MKTLYIKVKKILTLSLLVSVFSSVLYTSNSYALFEDLTTQGGTIFLGMKDIIYAVAGFGIFAVAIGGFFGNLNWKWLSAIIIGLVVIASTGALLSYMLEGTKSPTTDSVIQSLIDADGK